MTEEVEADLKIELNVLCPNDECKQYRLVNNKNFKGLNMISGENSIVTNVLKNAVSSSILAGSRRVSEKNRRLAVDNEIELHVHHQKAGHQTAEETARSIKTVTALKAEKRRWNILKGFYSYAETEIMK